MDLVRNNYYVTCVLRISSFIYISVFFFSYSILGEEVQGIWPKNADKADVNTAHVNPSGTAVATGDDYGCVKLFPKFPVSEPYVSTCTWTYPHFYSNSTLHVLPLCICTMIISIFVG